MKRILVILALTILCIAPLCVRYGATEDGALAWNEVPPEAAALAVRAARYELCTMEYAIPALPEAELEAQDVDVYQLTCYDAGDRILREITYSGQSVNYADHTYDASGNLLHRCVTLLDTMRVDEWNTYDEKGRLLENRTENTYLDGEGRASSSQTTYTYDADGRGTAVCRAGGGIMASSTETSLLDADGRVIWKELVFGDAPAMQAEYTYDANGELTRSVVTSDGEQTVNELRRQYDADGNCIRCDTYQNGVWETTEIRTYRDGRLAEARAESADGTVMVSTYRPVGAKRKAFLS